MFRKFSIFCFLVLVLGGVNLSTRASENPPFGTYLKQGISLLEHNPDSALSCFVKAYSQGLSRDSLFYYWSQSMIHKGVLDSALASNYMIKGVHTGPFRKDVLIQRYTIYRKLGWEKEAGQVLDSLNSLPSFSRSRFMPDIALGIKAGVDRGKTVTDTSSPWGGGIGSPVSETSNSFKSSADLKSTWHLSRGSSKLSFGIGMNASLQTGFSFSGDDMDSVALGGSAFLSYAAKTFSVGGDLSVDRHIDDTLLFGAGIQGGRIGKGKWLPILWGGAGVFLNTEGSVDNSRAWLFASARQPLNRIASAEYSGFVNVSIKKPYAFDLGGYRAKVLYAEDARLQYPVFYSGPDMSTVVDTAFIIRLNQQLLSLGEDTVVNVALKQPQASLMISPRAEISLKSRIPLQLGLSYTLDYYWEDYEWDQMRHTPDYLLYSRSEGKYYVLPPDPLLGRPFVVYADDLNLALSQAPLPGDAVEHHSQKRIDNTLSFDVKLNLHDGKAGKVDFRTAFSRTWSTLSRRAPFEIPQWSVSAMLEWRLRVKNSRI